MGCMDAMKTHRDGGRGTGRAIGAVSAAAFWMSVTGGCRTQEELPAGRPVDLQAFVASSAAGVGDAGAPGAVATEDSNSAPRPGASGGGTVARPASAGEEPARPELGAAAGQRPSLGAGSPAPSTPAGSSGSSLSRAAIGAGTGIESGAGAAATAGGGRRIQAGDSFVVDALVGQINGRPIFAGEFFEPLADQLRAIGRRVPTQTAFVQEAAEIVGNALSRRVEDALYLAEAEAALSPEERQGLRYWLAEIQNVTVAQRGGSRAEADRRLQATENRTLEEEVERIRNEGLQRKLIQEQILPRIIVSKYEIEREYQRRFDEFNPPPRTRVDRLAIRRSESELIAAVSARLEGGESIIDIAAEVAADGGGRVSQLPVFEVRPAELADSEKVSAVFREYAAGWKAEGDWTGPVESASSVSWYFVAMVDQAPGRPSYDEDVQRILNAELRNRKLVEELSRFKARLRQESIISQEQEMLETLVEIALRRYGPR